MSCGIEIVIKLINSIVTIQKILKTFKQRILLKNKNEPKTFNTYKLIICIICLRITVLSN